MARKVKKIEVSAATKTALEQGHKEGLSHCYRSRCQMILLKWAGYRSKEIAGIVGCCQMSVNNWVNRFEKQGMEGLKTKEGQGRKPTLAEEHLPVVRQAVQEERQRLSQAQHIIEQNTGKPLSKETLSRFLKLITAVTNA